MVAGTGHVGHVGCYGLDLPHELISNSGIVLEQCHLLTFPFDNNVSFFSLCWYSAKLVLRAMQVHFPHSFGNVSSAYQTNLTETGGVFLLGILILATQLLKTHCGSWLHWWLLPATAINDLSDKIPFLCFSIYNISKAAGCTCTFRLSLAELWLLIFAVVCWLRSAFLHIWKKRNE